METERGSVKTEVDPALQTEFEQQAEPVMAALKELAEDPATEGRVTYQTPMLETPGVALYIDKSYYGSVTPAAEGKFELNLGTAHGGSVVEDAPAIAARLRTFVAEQLQNRAESS